MRSIHPEFHLVERIGWLRAAVLGANDGIVSIASLILGVAAASHDRGEIMVAGVAGLVAGAMSMAAGEYVSVSSQADTETADLSRERAELASAPAAELEELSEIYQQRGVARATADEVARQMTEHDALSAHSRDELSITHLTTARPIQAALTSAATFTVGAALPLLVASVLPLGRPLAGGVAVTSLIFLSGLGAVSAKAGGAPVGKAVLRVSFWGAAAMAVTAGIGSLVGTAV